MAEPRFVILHHRVADGEHWDFMLEVDGRLATWRLETRPTVPHDLPISAERISDHRLAYLDYQGPLSGDRGEVTQVDRGVYRLRTRDDERWEFEIRGRHLGGRLILKRDAGPRWRLTAAPSLPASARPADGA